MSNEVIHRELSFIRDYSLKVGDYKEVSGLINDELYSWHFLADQNTFAIESAEENNRQCQYIESRHMVVFDYHSKSLISKDGFFYNKFDCKEYGWVERIYNTDYYICRKNDKYGLISGNGTIVMDIVYPLITKLPPIIDVDIDALYWYEPPEVREYRKEQLGENTKPYIILKITTYDGEYLLELTSKHKSKSYKKIYTFGENYLVENNGSYGLLSRLGEEVVPPNYKKAYSFFIDMSDMLIDERYRTGSWLEVEFCGRRVPIANNGRYYGEIPMEYEECICVGHDLVNKYRVRKNSKYGLVDYNCLSDKITEIIPIQYLSIKLDNHQPFYHFWKVDGTKKRTSFCLSIVEDKYGFQLYNINSKEIIGEHYQTLDFTYNRGRNTDYRHNGEYAPFFIAQKNDKFALLAQTGTPLTDFIYESILAMDNGFFPASKDKKWGVLDEWGKLLIECEWDKIENISSGKPTLYKEGKSTVVELRNMRCGIGTKRNSSYERPTYEKYNGSYAQDEMGYSDDDIDTIFDGDPLAYWNID